jgi:organic radical activating enzyme
MKKLIKLESSKKFLFIYWQINDFCNFKCNYCVPSLNQGFFSIKNKQLTPSNQTIINFIDNIKKQKNDKEIYFSLSGGEPTLHPLFREIINELHNSSRIELITNGSRSISWWKSLDHLPNIVRISLHPEYTDIDKINKLATYIISRNSLIRFNLSMDPDNWDQSKELYEKLDSNFKKFLKPKTLHDWSKKEKPIRNYTEHQKEWMKEIFLNTEDGREDFNLWNQTLATYNDGTTGKLDFIHASMKDHMYHGWKCSAGSTSISINTIGQVHAGLCKQRLLGNIENFKILEEYLTCRSIFCQCPTDLLIPKYKQ